MKESSDFLVSYAREIPKCELHVHLEGTLEENLKERLARYHGVTVIKTKSGFSDLGSFLHSYYEGVSVLRSEEDFFSLTYAYLEKAYIDNVMHCEMHFDPQAHTSRGVAFKTIVEGIRKAQIEAKAKFGISSSIILGILRDRPIDDAMRTIHEADSYSHWVEAIGLDSAENGYPCSLFRDVYSEAKRKGFKLTCHAGEEGPAQNVADAIQILEVDRIDHGVRMVDDIFVLNQVIDRNVPVTVCPLSNVKLGVCPFLSEHPLLTDSMIMDRGLLVSINSDDPAYFGGGINENFVSCIKCAELGWSRTTIKHLALSSVDSSFLPETDKLRLKKRIEDFDIRF